MSRSELFYSIALVVLGAPGFWQYFISPIIEKRKKKISPQDAALVGLLHERIYDECEFYKRRWSKEEDGISKARFEYIEKHLYQPYKDLGGNADAEKHIEELRDLISER